MDRVSALANKAGREVGTFIEEIQRNNCFRHTGIPPTDPEAPKWAAARPTESSIDVHHTEAEKILPTEDAVWVEGANGKILAVFTDGSAALTNTEWLSHGGWGVYISAKARTNRGGHLVGWPVTSYRAEVRAMVDAIARAEVRVCVISDNQAAVHTLQAIMKNPASPNQPWKNSDECADYWDWIKHRLEEFPAEYHEAQWMPSHLDEPTRAKQRDDFLSKGGDARWIDGNCGADEWANKGARLQAPTAALVLKEKYKRMITRAAQRMMVHIWAVHQGHLQTKNETNREICDPDEDYGIGYDDLVDWNAETVHEDALDGIFDDFSDENWEACDMDNPDQEAPVATSHGSRSNGPHTNGGETLGPGERPASEAREEPTEAGSGEDEEVSAQDQGFRAALCTASDTAPRRKKCATCQRLKLGGSLSS